MAVDVVHHAAGGADDNLGAAAQARDLVLNRLAAVDTDRAHALGVAGQAADLVADLHRQLARRAEDEHLRVFGIGVLEAGLDGGNAERHGLSGAGVRPADDIVSGEDGGDRLRLNLRRCGKAGLAQGAEHAVGEG